MINWISIHKQTPGDENKWVLIWDGSRIYPCLWVAYKTTPRGNIIGGHYQDMHVGAYNSKVTYWAELPLNPLICFDPQFVAPESERIRVMAIKAIRDALKEVSEKYPDMVLEFDETTLEITSIDRNKDE